MIFNAMNTDFSFYAMPSKLTLGHFLLSMFKEYNISQYLINYRKQKDKFTLSSFNQINFLPFKCSFKLKLARVIH